VQNGRRERGRIKEGGGTRDLSLSRKKEEEEEREKEKK
jgi:hypothetical protein